MADWESKIFQNMYKAASFLLGVGLHKLAGAPGTLAIITGKVTESTAIPAGLMVGLRIPSLVLNMHSVHALALFQALRAEGRYSEKREQMRGIQAGMDTLQKVIKDAIGTTGSAPETLPDAPAGILFDKVRYPAYLREVEEVSTNVKAYVAVLDAVLDDIEQCLVQWNKFLMATRKALKEDKPRNIFEQLGYYSLQREKDWAWYRDETGFSSSCNDLLRHREGWAKLLNLPSWGALTRLTFAND